MLKVKNEELINKCIVLFKESLESNMTAQSVFFSEFSKMPQYERLKTKLKETEDVRKKVEFAVVNNSYPVFTPREKILFINILQAVGRQLQSMELISTPENVDKDMVLYNQRIYETNKEIELLLTSLRQVKAL